MPDTTIDMPTWTIAGMLEKMRRDAGMTQQELADKADISVGTLGKILREETKEPELSTLVKIADAFGMSEVDLQVQLKKWNAAGEPETPSRVQPFADRRRPEFTDRAKDFARRYDQLSRPQRLALDAVLSAFEESNDTPHT